MKTLLLFIFCFITGSSLNAQTSGDNLDLPELLIGKWKVQEQNHDMEPKHIVFFADGTINLVDAGRNLSQRFRVTKVPGSYLVEILEVVNGRPISSFNIVQLNSTTLTLS